ncbi:unnamed protein product [Urochloa humidicola]
MDAQLDPGAGGLVPGRAGLAADSTLAFLCTGSSRTLAVAKPGDEHWTRLQHGGDRIMAALPFAGRLYCVTHRSVLVVETAPGGRQPPRLSLVADHGLDDGMFNQMYPVYVNDGGGLILVCRYASRLGVCGLDKIFAYGADLDTGSLVELWGLGGCALFVGAVRSQSVPVDARVSASVSADTVYTCDWDPFTAQRPRVLAFGLWGGEISRPNFDKKDITHYLACVE